MRVHLFLSLVLFCGTLVTHCSSSGGEDPALAAAFARAGVRGSFVLYDSKAEKFIHHNRARNHVGSLPASTFKVMNSLIGLETGVIEGPAHRLKWDGKKRFLSFWNRDHNLRSAIRYSVVWYYREMARRVGAKRMKAWLEKTGYGNGDIAAGVDLFWLQGGFRVTPMEQIKLLRRLHKGDLPFSKKNMNIVKDIMLVEKTKAYTMRGKTGLSVRGKTAIGWWIGYVEKGDAVYFFATRLEGPKATRQFIDARKQVTREILVHRGILPKQKP